MGNNSDMEIFVSLLNEAGVGGAGVELRICSLKYSLLVPGPYITFSPLFGGSSILQNIKYNNNLLCFTKYLLTVFFLKFNYLGPVVQSIFSLTNSLVVKM